MTTTAGSPRPLAADTPIPFARLVAVEARKLVDTRAGRWLLIIQAGLILVVLVIVAIVAGVQDRTIDFLDITQVAAVIMSLLLPVMGIMVVTSEWSQRTHMATFTLVPRPHAGVRRQSGGPSPWPRSPRWRSPSSRARSCARSPTWPACRCAGTSMPSCSPASWSCSCSACCWGFAFGTLILNTPGAIVAFVAYSMIVPGVFEVAATGIDAFADIRPWLDLANAQAPLVDDGRPLGDVGFAAVHWGQLALTTALWIGLPLVLGLRRVRRADIAPDRGPPEPASAGRGGPMLRRARRGLTRCPGRVASTSGSCCPSSWMGVPLTSTWRMPTGASAVRRSVSAGKSRTRRIGPGATVAGSKTVTSAA